MPFECFGNLSDITFNFKVRNLNYNYIEIEDLDYFTAALNLHTTFGGFVQAVEILLPVTAAKFINKSSLFVLSPGFNAQLELLLGFVLKLIELPSVRLHKTDVSF